MDSGAHYELIKLVGFYACPNYADITPFSTSTVEIRRLEKRAKSLKKIAGFEYKEIVKDNYKLVQDPAENRLMFYFDGKPEENIRAILKMHSFKWSPSRLAWVRMITENALYSAKIAMRKLDGLEIGVQHV